MKILAIRGNNLASLAGEFAIEFDSEPLAGAGLFAICGPTGAGKSTLLDALCVALFDKTPRLGERSRVLIGYPDDDDRLPASDVRGLLRRGAGEGFAEVDFIGRDQHRYRARWEVWRARRRPEGRMQNQQMSFEDLDSGKSLGGTKTETLQAIEDRLGLSFDQFRRSALLAQNEFAAFLRADERERGELLERMTGTEIYSALSRAAFEQHKQAAEELKRLQEQVDEHGVLADPEREALEDQREQARAALAGIDEEIKAAEAVLAWYERMAELADNEREAREALQDAEERWRAAEPVRSELEEIEAVRGYRAVVEAVDREHKACADAEAELAAAEERARTCESELEAADTALAEAEEAFASAQRAHEELKPLLEQAEQLDAELVAAERTAAQAEEAWQEAAAQTRAGAEARETLRGQLAQHETELAAAAAWLEDNAHLAPLADEWPRWKPALARYAELADQRREREAGREALLVEDERAREAVDAAKAAHDQARKDRDVARARADKAQLQADEVSLDAVRRERDAMVERAGALRRLAAAAQAAREAVDARDRYAAQAEAARRRAAGATARVEQLGADIAALSIRHEEAERALERVRLAVELSSHRGDLIDGEPCPLCGATEHPWAERSAPVDAMLAEERQRVADMRAELSRLEEQRAEAHAQVNAGRERAEECDRELAGAGAKLDRARAAWQAEIAALGELALMDDPAAEPAAAGVRARLQAAETELERLAAQEREAAELQNRARQAHSLAVARDSDLAQARDDLAECERRAREARAALDECDQARQRCAEDMAQIADAFAAELDPALVAKLAEGGSLQQDPRQFARRCQARVEDWQRRSAKLTELRMDLRAVRDQLATASKTLDQHTRREQALRHKHERLAAARDDARARRAEVLDGRSVREVRDQLGRDIEAAERARRAAQERRQGCAQAQAVAATRRDGCERALAQKRADRERADADLAEALARSGLDADTLRARCRVDDDWLRRHQTELAELQRQLDSARAVLAEREAQRHKHEAGGKPETDRDQAAAALDERRQAREEAQRALSDVDYRLRADDEARKKRADMAAQVAGEERRARLYKTLSDLIGSKDGKKFRVFAQSLTLDALLAYANRHLEELAGRYRLVRVPGYDLDLQVIDRDMGDEVRSINSLSGGESFLVSLALALGLSSLAARDTRVASLLIDEGFGSLDPATLEVALSVLDALQASGRKVGLISHVPGLAERVGVRIMVRPQGGGRSDIRVTER